MLLKNSKWNCISCGKKLWEKAVTGKCIQCRNTHRLLKERKCKDCNGYVSTSSKSGYCAHCCRIGERNANYGNKYSIKSRLRLSKALIGKNLGDKHPRWNGGWSKKYPAEFIRKRSLIRKRDNYTCQNLSCGITKEEYLKTVGKNLDVHHIDYDKQNCSDKNLLTLCSSCNIIASNDKDYWYAYYIYIMNKHIRQTYD